MFVRIITCESRFSNACLLLKDLKEGLEGSVELFMCIYGKIDLAKEGVITDLFLKLMGRINSHIPLTLTELAISMSHEKVLTEFLCSTHQYAMIFEDDCSLQPHMLMNLQIIVKTILSNPFDFGIIHLWNSDAGNTLKYADVSSHHFELVNENGEITRVPLKKEKRPYEGLNTVI